jgi:predicted AAA+ superfamily ATPase
MAEKNKPISNSFRRICFTGIRGTGKTTLVETVKQQNPDIYFMSGSDILQKLMGKSYSQFEFLPENDKYAYRLKVNQILCETQRENQTDLLVDSHLTVLNLKNGGIDTIFT